MDEAPANDAQRSAEGNLLELTLAAAERQGQTVTSEGVRIAPTIEGVRIRRPPTHVDDRGWLVELCDPRWEEAGGPIEYAYCTTIRPGYAKGWGFHKTHEDRYFVLFGEAETILYDVRPGSETYGQISTIRMSAHNRGLFTIPRLVWHATRNLGAGDVVVVNFPTIQFDHANPDKYTLPLDTPLIPYSFEGTPG